MVKIDVVISIRDNLVLKLTEMIPKENRKREQRRRRRIVQEKVERNVIKRVTIVIVSVAFLLVIVLIKLAVSCWVARNSASLLVSLHVQCITFCCF